MEPARGGRDHWTASRFAAASVRPAAHVGEHDVLEAELVTVHWVVDRRVGADHQARLAVGVGGRETSNSSGSESRRGPVRRWWVASSASMSPASCTRDRRARPGGRTRARGPRRVRGQDHASARLATASIRSPQEAAPRQRSRLATGSSRISSSGRLARPSVSASCAAGRRRACAPSARGRGRAARRASAKPWSQAGLRCAPSTEVVVDAEVRVGGRALATNRPRRPRTAARPTPIVPEVGDSMSTARLSSVLLPAPLGPTRPTTRRAARRAAIRQRDLA